MSLLVMSETFGEGRPRRTLTGATEPLLLQLGGIVGVLGGAGVAGVSEDGAAADRFESEGPPRRG